jgi:hypothetical protein
VHKQLPGAQIHPGTAYHGALVHHSKHRYRPLLENEREIIVAGT